MTRSSSSGGGSGVRRRPLLLGAAGAVLVSSQLADRASAGPRRDLTITHTGRPWYRLDAEGRGVLPWTGPGPATLEGLDRVAVTQILEFRWDARLVELVSAVAMAASTGEVRPVHGTFRRSADTASFRLPLLALQELGRTGAPVVVAPRFLPRDALQRDALVAVEPTRVALLDARGREVVRAAADGDVITSAAGETWAASLAVLWSGADAGAAADTFAFARTVLVQSDGPGSVPAGTRVTLRTDRRAVEGLSLRSAVRVGGDEAEIKVSSSSDGPSSTLTVVLEESMSPGDRVRLELGARSVDPGPSLTERSACIVAIDHARSGGVQLDTGSSSLALIS